MKKAKCKCWNCKRKDCPQAIAKEKLKSMFNPFGCELNDDVKYCKNYDKPGCRHICKYAQIWIGGVRGK